MMQTYRLCLFNSSPFWLDHLPLLLHVKAGHLFSIIQTPPDLPPDHPSSLTSYGRASIVQLPLSASVLTSVFRIQSVPCADVQHAMRLIEFQTRRGGKVVLAALAAPQSEFEHEGGFWGVCLEFSILCPCLYLRLYGFIFLPKSELIF